MLLITEMQVKSILPARLQRPLWAQLCHQGLSSRCRKYIGSASVEGKLMTSIQLRKSTAFLTLYFHFQEFF